MIFLPWGSLERRGELTMYTLLRFSKPVSIYLRFHRALWNVWLLGPSKTPLGVMIPCRAKGECKTSSMPVRPSSPSEPVPIIPGGGGGGNQRCNICTSLVRLEPREPFQVSPTSSFSAPLPSTQPPTPPPRSLFQQLQPCLAKPRMLCTHLVWGHCISGIWTVDLCIPQKEAPTRQIHFSLVNTHYPESLNFEARLFFFFFKLSSHNGKEQSRWAELNTLGVQLAFRGKEKSQRAVMFVSALFSAFSPISHFHGKKNKPCPLRGWNMFKSFLANSFLITT